MDSTGRRVVTLATTLLLAASLAACDEPTDANSGQLVIRLTDAPLQGLTSVNVYIAGLKLKPAGQPEQNFALDVGVVDLLTLNDSSMVLAAAPVPAGEFEYIMVELDAERSGLVINSQHLPVRIPSEKIKVFGPFAVREDGTTTATLDFDAARSLQQLGNGDWLMTPIIVLAVVEGS